MSFLVVALFRCCSLLPSGGGVAIIFLDSSLLFSVGVECGMPSSERASYSPHSRWETVGYGFVCAGGPEVEQWADGPVWWNVSRVYAEDLCNSVVGPQPYACPFPAFHYMV